MTTRFHPRLAYVPEHFATPIYHAKSRLNLPASLYPYPSGTGHMIEDLLRPIEDDSAIDIGVGLTEAWIARLSRMRVESSEGAAGSKSLPFKLIGGLVESPLRWAISTGHARTDIEGAEQGQGAGVEALRGRRCGISREGSGSHVMAKVWAQERGWMKKDQSDENEGREVDLHFVRCGPFADLRAAVQAGDDQHQPKADFFMWDHTTTKGFWKASNSSSSVPSSEPGVANSLKRVGEVYTPWPSWTIVARTSMIDGSPVGREQVRTILGVLDDALEQLLADPEELIVRAIVENPELHYSEQDARSWLSSVQFRTGGCAGVDPQMVRQTADRLALAGAAPVLDPEHVSELVADLGS